MTVRAITNHWRGDRDQTVEDATRSYLDNVCYDGGSLERQAERLDRMRDFLGELMQVLADEERLPDRIIANLISADRLVRPSED